MSLDTRTIGDPNEIRALTHTVRLTLLELLAQEGRPLTATEAGDLVGLSPTTCSFHLRQLAKYGFVEEAERGPGRRRPWRLSQLGINVTDAQQEPESAHAAVALGRTMAMRWLERAREQLDRRHELPAQWQSLTGQIQFLVHLTPDELAEIENGFVELLSPYRARTMDLALRPQGSRPIETLAFFYPVETQP